GNNFEGLAGAVSRIALALAAVVVVDGRAPASPSDTICTTRTGEDGVTRCMRGAGANGSGTGSGAGFSAPARGGGLDDHGRTSRSTPESRPRSRSDSRRKRLGVSTS